MPNIPYFMPVTTRNLEDITDFFPDKTVDINRLYKPQSSSLLSLNVGGKLSNTNALMAIVGFINAHKAAKARIDILFINFKYLPYGRCDCVNDAKQSQLTSFLEIISSFLDKNSDTVPTYHYTFDTVHSKYRLRDSLGPQNLQTVDENITYNHDSLDNATEYYSDRVKVRDCDVYSADESSDSRAKHVVNKINNTKERRATYRGEFMKRRGENGEITSMKYSKGYITPSTPNTLAAVIVDDIVDGGRTVIECAKLLKSKYKYVFVVAAHIILSDGLEPFKMNTKGDEHVNANAFATGRWIDGIMPSNIVGDYVTRSEVVEFTDSWGEQS